MRDGEKEEGWNGGKEEGQEGEMEEGWEGEMAGFGDEGRRKGGMNITCVDRSLIYYVWRGGQGRRVER